MRFCIDYLVESGTATTQGTRQYSEEARVLLSQRDSLILREGILYRKFHYPDGSTNFLQIVLPAKLHHSCVEQLHADLGHFGWMKTSCCLSSCLHSGLAIIHRTTSSQLCSVQPAPAESSDTPPSRA